MQSNNTQFPPEYQPHPDYVRSTRFFAMNALGLVGEQIDEFIRVDRTLDWFEADPRRINRWPMAYKTLKERYAELNAPAVTA
jgi:hypothetical protein